MKNLPQILVIAFFLISNISFAQHAVVTNTKMNVVYIGVDNPIEVAVSEHSVEDITVEVSQGSIEGNNGTYSWKVNRPGSAEVTVSANGKVVETFKYRVKRIPDPIAKVGNKMSGSMSVGAVKAQEGVSAVLENFDFDARCSISSYTVTVIRKDTDAVESTNKGGRFSSQTKSLINMVKPGSVVYIENITCRCPGDSAARRINSIVIKVK